MQIQISMYLAIPIIFSQQQMDSLVGVEHSCAWAPTIEEKNGKYYFYFCAKREVRASYIGVDTSESPTGPFVAEEEPLLTPEIVASQATTMGKTIAPSILTTRTEKVTCIWQWKGCGGGARGE